MKYQSYFSEYQDITRDKSIGNKYISGSSSKINFSNICNIYMYNFIENKSSTQEISAYEEKFRIKKKSIFIIVPSIFNSPEILFLNRRQESNFMASLQRLGEVYLIDWLQINDPMHSMNSYAIETEKVICYLYNKTNNLINLIGHCIGGDIAIAGCILQPRYIRTLTLMTSPWDFMHFPPVIYIHKYFNLNDHIKLLPYIPKIYINILFFLLFSKHFDIKIEKYFELNTSEEKKFFMCLEHWLITGNSIPKSAYFQITNEWVTQNVLRTLDWAINEIVIDPSKINIPTCHVSAKKDQLVPKSSIIPLHSAIKNSKIIEVEGGHVSYLINSSINDFFVKYKQWLYTEEVFV